MLCRTLTSLGDKLYKMMGEVAGEYRNITWKLVLYWSRKHQGEEGGEEEGLPSLE